MVQEIETLSSKINFTRMTRNNESVIHLTSFSELNDHKKWKL